jgi:hypothetical protein
MWTGSFSYSVMLPLISQVDTETSDIFALLALMSLVIMIIAIATTFIQIIPMLTTRIGLSDLCPGTYVFITKELGESSAEVLYVGYIIDPINGEYESIILKGDSGTRQGEHIVIRNSSGETLLQKTENTDK